MKTEMKLLSMGAALLFGAGAMSVDGAASSLLQESEYLGNPNLIIIFTDDQGYADLGCFGSPTIQTPRLDTLAGEGLKLTSFYAQPVCGPSRAALLTGCYPSRVFPEGRGIGRWTLSTDEVTVAEVLKEAGYATGCIGKWDVSGRKFVEGRVPNDQGFDYYFGTLGANDGGHVQFYRNKERAGKTSDMGSLTRQSTDEAIKFIRNNQEHPFFLYLAYNMPHVKIGASDRFRGKSKGDLYGDVIEEIDWNVGRLIDVIKEFELDTKTIVLFASDNGPWSDREEGFREKHGGHLATGSPGPLRGSKASTWEGGVRVPAIVWGPGLIKGGRVSAEIVSTLDVLPTFASLAGTAVKTYRRIDGVDQSALLTGASEQSARNDFFYLRGSGALQGVRRGRWKLVSKNKLQELYDLESDLAEKRNVAADHPDLVRELQAQLDAFAELLKTEKKMDIGTRPSI